MAAINLASEDNYEHHAEEDHEETLHPSFDLCCCLPGLQSKWQRQGENVSRRHLLRQQQQQQQQEEGDQIGVVEDRSWIVKSAKKMKVLSEVLAGPKWKNFIRRLSKCRVMTNKKRKFQFHYDPQSYALNFNEGIDREEDGASRLEFSGRYADPLGMNRGQGDLA